MSSSFSIFKALVHCVLACSVSIEKSVISDLLGTIYFSVWELINRTIILLSGLWDFTICSQIPQYVLSVNLFSFNMLGPWGLFSLTKWIARECLKGKKLCKPEFWETSVGRELEFVFLCTHSPPLFILTPVLRSALCLPIQSESLFILPENKFPVIFLNGGKEKHWDRNWRRSF